MKKCILAVLLAIGLFGFADSAFAHGRAVVVRAPVVAVPVNRAFVTPFVPVAVAAPVFVGPTFVPTFAPIFVGTPAFVGTVPVFNSFGRVIGFR